MISKLKEGYTELDKTKQLRIKQFSIALAIFTILILSYWNRVEENKQEEIVENKQEVVDVVTDGELFEEDISDEFNDKLKKANDLIKKQSQDIERLKELFMLEAKDKGESEAPVQQNAKFPDPKKQVSVNNPQRESLELQIQPTWVGGIVHQEYQLPSEPSASKEKSNIKIIKFTPGFMEGFLLTGMDAMTIEGSSDTPEPMLIRVQAPAVLPNEVKANLKGCFVVAEGYGNLATHRVDARLKSLSCIDVKGGTVIHEKIKGFVQDGDGKKGLKGVPVHRAGALIARSMIAGVFEGIGGALTSNAQTTSISALGNTNTTPSNNLGRAALGGGISAGAKDVRALFLQLARQSSPVIEVGAAKHITVVITDLVELKIQEL